MRNTFSFVSRIWHGRFRAGAASVTNGAVCTYSTVLSHHTVEMNNKPINCTCTYTIFNPVLVALLHIHKTKKETEAQSKPTDVYLSLNWILCVPSVANAALFTARL